MISQLLEDDEVVGLIGEQQAVVVRRLFCGVAGGRRVVVAQQPDADGQSVGEASGE